MKSFLRGLRQNKQKESDKIHYTFGNTKRPKDSKCKTWCCGRGNHRCCSDVWGNFFINRKKSGTPRDCSKDETYELDFLKVFVKQIVSTTLFGLVCWFVYITDFQRNTVDGQNVTLPFLFDCNGDSRRSIISVDEVENDFIDEGVQFCYFKSTMVLFSNILLFPFLLETVSVLTIVWVSSINSSVLVPIVEGKYVGNDVIFNTVLSSNPFKRAAECALILYNVPKEILRLNEETENPVTKWLLVTEMVWKLLVFMVPDVLLTSSLFLVSYYVMISSDTPEDILVNLVAVQVFAELSDKFVKLLLSPRASCGEKIGSYVNDNPHSTKAVYRPFQAYLLNELRHQMGIRVAKNDEMFYYHNYTGHHLTRQNR